MSTLYCAFVVTATVTRTDTTGSELPKLRLQQHNEEKTGSVLEEVLRTATCSF